MDRGDFAAAVDRHYPGLVQRLTLVLHDAEEAKDVAQEAYLKAFQAWDRFPERIDLWRALGELKPQQRAALLLNVVDGYTQAQIARILDAPEGTVASWVSEAKRRLRGILGEDLQT